MKKIITLLLAAMMVFSLAACGGSEDAAQVNGPEEGAVKVDDGVVYKIGVVQLVQHPALDSATQGFMDGLAEELGTNHLEFDVQNASGDSTMCTTIVNGFVSSNVDLIMANATPALVAAASATSEIPVLGTSVTDYGSALELEDFDGVVGTNVSGTSDLPPLDEQAAMVTEFCPSAKTVAILYCSAETNSVYQAKAIRGYLEEAGLEVIDQTFTDSNDVAAATTAACDKADVIFIPTDNTAASCAEAIGQIVLEKKVPVIAGEEGLMASCGIATLSIDYYSLGVATGKMAAKVLTGEADISEMAIEYDPDPVKKYNPAICEQLGIEVPEGYVAYEG